MHLERRFGWATPLIVFLLAGAGGALLSVEIDPNQPAIGANGAALGLLCAWLVMTGWPSAAARTAATT